jgi:excisionase family DNA binding protein
MKQYVTIEVESKRLGVSVRHMRNLVSRRIIPSYKIGRRRLCVPQETDRALELNCRMGRAVPA